MTTVTLELVKAEQTKLAAMIAALESTAPKLLALRETQVELKAGERYAGLLLSADGLPSRHLVLLPGEAEDVGWVEACEWAAKVGGELPTRQEQALLYANLKSEFQPAWYWSSQQHESNGSCAWHQNFSYGGQDNNAEFRGPSQSRPQISRLILQYF